MNRRKTPRDTDRLQALQELIKSLTAESQQLRQRLTTLEDREQPAQLAAQLRLVRPRMSDGAE
jgi:DnaJ-domain-containing protein 1